MAASKNTRRSRTAPGVGDPVMAAAGSHWSAAPTLGELFDADPRILSWLVDIKPDRHLRDQGAGHHELQPLRQLWRPGMAEPVRLPSLDRGCTSKHWRSKRACLSTGPFALFGGEGGIRTLTFVYHSTNTTFTFNDLRF
jgi:hypothetical protein